ncbi:hypothetical protein BCCH1_77950 (plasmid) [Burkholderia contaminans]|uniref:Uncharacterized protein n=1 Tax=Burkholderia contaminans TaxID=488447 RepID=A0A250LL71_9BURK|nr:hypothetical protein BCCH1_77950 [Burkholderia contaminans]
MLNIRGEAVDHDLVQAPGVIEDFGRRLWVERFPWHVTCHYLQKPKWNIGRPGSAPCKPPNQPDAQMDVSPSSEPAPNSALPAPVRAKQENVCSERLNQGAATAHASEGGAPNKKFVGDEALRTAGEWET